MPWAPLRLRKLNGRATVDEPSDVANAVQLLTVKEVAAHLNISSRTVYRMVHQGLIPAHRVGGLWRFRAQEIYAWVQAARKV